jgi:hypothetical protein
MNAREYLAGTTAKVATETFRPVADQDDHRAFRVTLTLCSKPELEAMLRSCSTKTLERLPNGQRDWKDSINPTKLRERMAAHVTEWDGLTYGLLADLANLQTPNGDKSGWADKPVPAETDNVIAAMETVLGFEDWLLTKLTSLADVLGREEVRSKNASASTPPASTTT